MIKLSESHNHKGEQYEKIYYKYYGDSCFTTHKWP